MAKIDIAAVKRESEAIVRQYGGQICDWLPSPDPDSQPRNLQTVVRRALILNAMIQIAFKAPISVVKGWIEANGLEGDLAGTERAILSKSNSVLTQQELLNLHWYIEALWTFVWVGGIIPDIPINIPVGNHLASLCPSLRHNEDGTKFTERMKLRPHEELFRQLDLYYRAHWSARNAQLTGQNSGSLRIDIIMERRKALEWVLNAGEGWDDVEMST